MKNKFTLLIAILILAISNLLRAGDTDETNEIAAKLNALQGTSNSGREYLFSIPPPYDAESGGFDNFIRIFVNSPVTTNVKVGIGGSYKSFKTLGNGLTVIDFPAFNVIPFKFIATATQPAAKIYKDKSIHIMAEEPVIVYVIVRFKYTTDGFLAIPITALGKEYAIASQPQWGGGFGYKLTPFVNITAAYDKTNITFTMGGGAVQSFTEVEGGILLGNGQSKSYNLNKGETLVFCASSKAANSATINGDGQDLAGSRVSSNRPLAVVTGHTCSNVPMGNTACDYLVEMELPTTTWGKNIIVPNLPDRKNAGIIRLFGKEDSTEIFRNGLFFNDIPSTVGAEGESFISERVWPLGSTPRPAVFTSSKPFNAVFFNTGVTEDGSSESDPFSMNLIPIEQYQNDMYLCTPNAAGGDPFNKNWLNIVIEADENGLIPDDFEFGTFTSDWQWQKVKNINGQIDNSLPKFKMDNNPSNQLVKYLIKNIALPFSGVFRLRCTSKKFIAYSYGYGYFEAYGYPTGSAMKDLTTEDRLTPIPFFVMECDGENGMSVKNGKVLDPIINNDPSTQSKLSDIYMKRNESYNYDFKVLSQVEPEETEQVAWSLTKINPREDSKAVLVFIDLAGNDTTITIEDIATKLDLSKDTDFGNFKKNEPSVSRTFTLTNNSKKQVMLKDLKLWRMNQGFKIEQLNWQMSKVMQIGEARDIKITFTPDSNLPKGFKLFIDSLGVGDSCIFMNLVEVRASLGEPRIKADDWNFGTTDILFPSPLSKNIRLRNPSFEADLKITKASKLNDSSFTAIFNLPTIKMLSDITPNNPLIIKENSFIDFTVYFKPNRVGIIRDSIVFNSDADSIDNITYLNGNGIDSISLDVSEEFLNNIEISTNANSIYISNANQENLSYRLSDLQGKLISTGVLNSTNEITLKEQSAQALIIEIINKESKVLIRKKLIWGR